MPSRIPQTSLAQGRCHIPSADFGRYQRVDDATVPVRLEDVERVGIVGNVLNGTGKATIAGKNGALMIRSNIGLDDCQ
ncbi:MAG: hypothetical protein ACLQNE_23470 [Thermoguttaceae bacterium]